MLFNDYSQGISFALQARPKRSELGYGPLALRNFTLPAKIFSVDAATAAPVLSGGDAEEGIVLEFDHTKEGES